MKEGNSIVAKIVLGGAGAIAVAVLIFFSFNDIILWMTFNDPFQNQWASVQLSDGEILYGHLAGVNGTTIGLKDAYLLDKFTPAPSTNAVATSSDFSIGGTLAPAQRPKYVPVSDTEFLFVNRAAVLYFKFLQSDDPALPYLP